MDLLGSAEIATKQEHPTTQGQGYQGKIHSDPNICHIGQAEELEKIGPYRAKDRHLGYNLAPSRHFLHAGQGLFSKGIRLYRRSKLAPPKQQPAREDCRDQTNEEDQALQKSGGPEDLSFCMRARDVGSEIYCDSRIKVGHIGQYTFSEEGYKP